LDIYEHSRSSHELDLSGEGIQDIPQALIDKSSYRQGRHIDPKFLGMLSLTLSNNTFTMFPELITEYTSLESLYLSGVTIGDEKFVAKQQLLEYSQQQQVIFISQKFEVN
jgi:hypothetical protein